MRYGSVCSGVEAASLAWKPMGWQPAWFAEIEPFPAAVLNHHWPHIPNHGDMTKLEARILSGEIEAPDVLVGGTPCFTAGNVVMTDRGFIPIEEVRVGDLVVTHKGRLRRVLRIGSKTAEVGMLSAVGLPDGILCTKNHPFLSQNWQWKYSKAAGELKRIETISEPEWVAAEDMVGRQWVSLASYDIAAKPDGAMHSELSDSEVMMLAGMYLGDGWLRRWTGKNKKAVVFGFNPDKYAKFSSCFNDLKYTKSTERTVIKVTVYDTELAEFFLSEFGENAIGKRLPAWVLSHAYREALLDGYVLTDGHKKSNGFDSASISVALAYGIAALAQTLGYVASVRKIIVPETKLIEGRLVNQRPYYQVRAFYQSVSKKSRLNENRILRTVSGFETVGADTVYNLEVEDDNSYIVNNAVVHNCQAFSVAGLRNRLDDERGNLTLVLVRILNAIDEVRKRLGKPPAILVWENVPGVLSTRDNAFGSFLGGLAGEELPLEPAGKKWTNAGCVFGEKRNIAWRTLDAQFFGVPQRRKRVFLVAGAGAVNAAEILFERQSESGSIEKGTGQKQDVAGFVEAGFGDYKRRDHAGTVKRSGGAIGGGSETLVVHGRQDPCVSDKAFCLDNQAAGNTNVGVTVAATLSTGFGSRGLDSEQIFNGDCVIDYPQVRRLTPLECERLQGFPDNHTRIPWRGKAAEECPDAPRYKACGNSMAVPCMRWIGKRINGEK